MPSSMKQDALRSSVFRNEITLETAIFALTSMIYITMIGLMSERIAQQCSL